METEMDNNRFFYPSDGPGLEIGQPGPRDHRRDGVLGEFKHGLDYAQMNKYHGKVLSFFLGLVVWVFASAVGAAFTASVCLVLFPKKSILVASLSKEFLLNSLPIFMFLLFVNLVAFGMPYIFFLAYRTQKSFWTSLKFTLWGSIISRFTSGGGNKGVNRINRINMFGY